MTIKVYMIVTNDSYEMPIKIGLVGAQSVADYLGLSVNRARKNLCSGIWNHKQPYKAVVDDIGTIEEIAKRKIIQKRKNFMLDRTEYYKKYRMEKRKSAIC